MAAKIKKVVKKTKIPMSSVILAGMPANIFSLKTREIEAFVKKYNIQAEILKTAAISKSKDFNIRGGKMVPHFHIKDKLYTLTQSQWVDFSSKILPKLKTEFAKVKSISYDNFGVFTKLIK